MVRLLKKGTPASTCCYDDVHFLDLVSSLCHQEAYKIQAHVSNWTTRSASVSGLPYFVRDMDNCYIYQLLQYATVV